MRTHDDELIGNPLDLLAHPFTWLPSPSEGHEPQAMPAVRKWRDLLHLNKLWHEREAVLRHVEKAKDLLHGCVNRDRLPDPLSHVNAAIPGQQEQ